QSVFDNRNGSGFPTTTISDTIAICGRKMDERLAVAVLAALAHAVRLRLWCILLPEGQLGLSAGSIAGMLDIAPSSLSFHLHQMTYAGVLMQRRSNRRIIYAVNTDVVDALRAFLVSPAG
ncbi:MAG: hypothetical protein WB495_21250, partial [Xanthobacteraceae bacterium]